MRPGEWRRQLLSVDSWDYQLMVSQRTLFYSTEICEQHALKCKTFGAYVLHNIIGERERAYLVVSTADFFIL